LRKMHIIDKLRMPLVAELFSHTTQRIIAVDIWHNSMRVLHRAVNRHREKQLENTLYVQGRTARSTFAQRRPLVKDFREDTDTMSSQVYKHVNQRPIIRLQQQRHLPPVVAGAPPAASMPRHKRSTISFVGNCDSNSQALLAVVMFAGSTTRSGRRPPARRGTMMMSLGGLSSPSPAAAASLLQLSTSGEQQVCAISEREQVLLSPT
jgi:hypothetical protein